MATDRASKVQRIVQLAQIFTPAAPVRDVDLFAGRNTQVMECISDIFQPGLHIAIYGERGVGKTSLANVLPKIIQEAERPGLKAVRVDCNTADTFSSLWRKIFRDLEEPWASTDDGELEPDGIRFRLGRDGQTRLIVIDELDRLEDDEALTMLADTLKTLADHTVDATLMLVGVGTSIEELVGEHASIVRSLAEIKMPRMRRDELRTILERGFKQAHMGIDQDSLDAIADMAEGLPHFVHLLALHAGQIAIENDDNAVTVTHVADAMAKATRSHVVLSEYHKAIDSSQPGNLFEEVLLACAFAQKDELGFFRAADVCDPLTRIRGKVTAIPAFARHLAALSSDTRGYTLQKRGEPHSVQYRFSNPLLEPFAKIVGASKGKLPEQLLQEMGHAAIPRPSPFGDWPTAQPPPVTPPPGAPED
jgi:Cdc6-like AAA superfamily ATPase